MLNKLGFAEPTPVATLRSIAHLFGSTKNRCGIYLLEFPKQKFYIGQAVEVVRRFAQHRKTYEEIVGFSFIPTRQAHLNDVEKDLIRMAERQGIVLLNVIHVSDVVVDTDLDLVVSPEEQAAWLSSPARINRKDEASPIELPPPQYQRFAEQFRRFSATSLFSSTSKLLKTYLTRCIPLPIRTEYSFWVVSCLPSTNRNSWPRLFCVSAGVMELLVIGTQKGKSEEIWGFVNVASDVLKQTYKTDKALRVAFPYIEIYRRNYKDAGQHQISLQAHDSQTMKALLQDKVVQQAAATLALRVMRKRATIYSKFHCKQLADSVLA